MYKITLYDMNCSPICDGTAFWFVEDLEKFEQNWLPLQGKRDVSRVERYYKSKFGEIVTDYYSDSEELNIVQKINAEVIEEKDYEYKNKEVELINAYGWPTNVGFDLLQIKLRVLKCNDTYYLTGQYLGNGFKRVELNWNRWYEKEVKYAPMYFCGNPVAKCVSRDINWDDWDKEDRYKDFYTNDKDFYKHDKIETFVWLPIKEVSGDYKIRELDERELAILMRDIVGEAG